MNARYRLQQFTVTSAPAEYLPKDMSRKYLVIQNQGSGELFVSFDTPAVSGLWIPPGDAWEPPIPPTNRICLAATPSTTAVILEC